MLYLFPKAKRTKSSLSSSHIKSNGPTPGKERYYDQFTGDMKQESLQNMQSMRTIGNEDVIIGEEDESKRINADYLNSLIEKEK